MLRSKIAPVSVALLVVLAGCAALPGGGDTDAGAGTVNVFVSDEPNAVGQFEHVNVTITSVGFHRSNATDDTNETGWVERDVDDRTVDLTELRGANASHVANVSVPAGEYDTVFVHVADSSGTLENGTTVDVKLPSSKLHVNKNVTVESGESVDFVFDITVVEAGNSGKYVLKPVVSESGTDVEMRRTTTAAGGSDSTTTTQAQVGTVNYYLSDERNAIGQFEHLNVTISSVGLHRENETSGTNGSAWVTRDVDDATVDLTELQGANATLLTEMEVPNGTYDTAFVHVASVEGVLQDGSETNVKLPSGKLHVQKQFVVSPSSETDFVFDATVVEAGNSGKYVLEPVVSDSGTDVPIEKRGDGTEPAEETATTSSNTTITSSNTTTTTSATTNTTTTTSSNTTTTTTAES